MSLKNLLAAFLAAKDLLMMSEMLTNWLCIFFGRRTTKECVYIVIKDARCCRKLHGYIYIHTYVWAISDARKNTCLYRNCRDQSRCCSLHWPRKRLLLVVSLILAGSFLHLWGREEQTTARHQLLRLHLVDRHRCQARLQCILVTHNLQLSCACFLDNKLLLTRQWLNMLTIPWLLVFLFLDFLFPFSHLSFPVELFRVCMYVPQGLQLSVLFLGIFLPRWSASPLFIRAFGFMLTRLFSLVFLFNCFFSCSCSSVSFLIPKLSPSLVLVILFPFLIPKLSLLQHDCQLLQHFLRCVQNKIFPRLIWDSHTKKFCWASFLDYIYVVENQKNCFETLKNEKECVFRMQL